MLFEKALNGQELSCYKSHRNKGFLMWGQKETKLKKIIGFALAFLFWSIVSVSLVFAQSGGPSTESPIDLIVTIDDSGSNFYSIKLNVTNGITETIFDRTQGTDTNNLRFSAARLIYQIADPSDRIGLITFSGDPYEILPVAEIGGLRSSLIEKIPAPNDPEGDGSTGISKALNLSVDKLLQTTSNHPRYILFLTDGYPTRPGSSEYDPSQIDSVRKTVERAKSNGITIIPILLCGNTNMCKNEYARGILEAMITNKSQRVREVGDAEGLVSEFADVFQTIKSNIYVIKNKNFRTADYQDVRQLDFVTAKNSTLKITGPSNSNISGETKLTSDQNIKVDSFSRDIPSGLWQMEGDQRGFAIARVNRFPVLVFPPASIENDITSTRFIPKYAKPRSLLITAKPSAAVTQPLLLSNKAMSFLDQSLYWSFVASRSPFTLQIGPDQSGPNTNGQLAVRRTFRIEEREDLPKISSVSDSQSCPALIDCNLKVTLSAPVEHLEGELYLLSQNDNENDEWVKFDLKCTDISCQQTNASQSPFRPESGQKYRLIYFIKAKIKGITFGDFADVSLETREALTIPDLPNPLSLQNKDYPTRIIPGTLRDLGMLSADVSLHNLDDKNYDPLGFVSIIWNPVVLSPKTPASSILKVSGADLLKPGRYEGLIHFRVGNPAPDGIVRMPENIEIKFNVERPIVTLENTLDFGTIMLEDDPNFKIDQKVKINARFRGIPNFDLLATSLSSDLFELKLDKEKWQKTSSGSSEEIYSGIAELVSIKQITRPDVFKGQARIISSSNKELEIRPDSVNWMIRVDKPEFTILGDGALTQTVVSFSPFIRANEPLTATIRIRYSGDPNRFPSQLRYTLTVTDANDIKIDESFFTLNRKGDLRRVPSQNNIYDVNLELNPKRDAPRDIRNIIFPAVFSGKLRIDVAGSSSSIDQNFTVIPYKDKEPVRIFCISPIIILIFILIALYVKNNLLSEKGDED